MVNFENEDVSITMAGHSLGAALGSMNAMDVVANGYIKNTGSATEFPVTAFAYASPRVGDKGLMDAFTGLTNLHILRMKNANDGIPNFPPTEFGFVDLGDELFTYIFIFSFLGFLFLIVC